jgi:hypothetical protein
VSWRGLRYKATEILTSREWNAVVDALNDLYGFLTSGLQDIYVDEVYGRAGYFSEQLLVQGRPVIKDGDPISIYQFYDIAKQQITEAIDESSQLARIASSLEQIYGKLPSREDITLAVDSSAVAAHSLDIREYARRTAETVEAYAPRLATIEQYAREVRDVVVRLRIDEYGNVGVRIAEPLDEYGRVVVSAAAVANPPNLDVPLSTRASEGTLVAIRDRLPSSLTTAGNFRVAILEDAVGLAKEATLSAIKNALASVGTDKLRVSVVDALPESPINISRVGGTAVTGRDWSQDFAKLQNLDVALSSRASESTLSAIAGALASRATDKLRVSVVDSLPRSPFTLYDSAGNELSGYVKNLDVPLSSLKASVDSINIAKVAGTALTPRDWSQDFARLQNLDIALSALRDAVLSKLDELGKLVLLGYTTTPLPANASWTSPVDSDPATGRIVGSVYTDQPGTLCVEQSPDGVNWDVVDCFSVSAGSGLGFSVEKVCMYARVRYVNGATAQTVFRLYVYRRLRVI